MLYRLGRKINEAFMARTRERITPGKPIGETAAEKSDSHTSNDRRHRADDLKRFMLRIFATMGLAFVLGPAQAQNRPVLEIVWPGPGSVVELGNDAEKAIGVIVSSNFTLLPAGQCGGNRECGHVHMKIDPDGDSCNIPGKPYNSMNSDFGGDLVKAHFGHCPLAAGKHVIGVLLADDRHQPILIDGKPVTALVTVTTK